MTEFVELLHSEWTKLRTVRSTYWSTLVAIVLGVGLSAAISAANASSFHTFDASERVQFDPTALSTSGLFFAQLALGVIAVLSITAEFSTGMIRTTLCAVPQRNRVIAAKGVVVAAVTWVVGVATAFAAFFCGQAIFARKNLQVTLGDPGVARAVIGAALYLVVLVLFAVGLGAIIRHTAGAITALVGLVFVLPAVSNAFPDRWQHDFARYLPANSGGALTTTYHNYTSLSPWIGFAVFCIWAAAALAVGGYLLRRRDV